MQDAAQTAGTEEVQNEDRQPVDLLKPETCPPALKKFYTDDQRAEIARHIEQGNIVAEAKMVTIKKKNTGTGRDETWPFILYRAVQVPGMTALAKGNGRAAKPLPEPEELKKLSERDQLKAKNAAEDGACDYFNYGYGLTISQPVRVLLASRIGGPDKEIDKQVRQVMKTGLFASEDMARSFVIAQRKTLNLSVPDAFATEEDEEETATA